MEGRNTQFIHILIVDQRKILNQFNNIFILFKNVMFLYYSNIKTLNIFKTHKDLVFLFRIFFCF